MLPIISVVGKSNSGKTTLLEALITELKGRGYKIAVMKHSAEDVELDRVNKDTWRFSQAGSEISAISSGHKLAVFKRLERDFSPEELSRLIVWDCDLILTEGFKRSKYPKIEVHRQEQGKDLVSPVGELLAVVTDEPLEVAVPQLSKGEVKKLADLIEIFLSQRNEDDIDLLINGTYTQLDPSTRRRLTKNLIDAVSSLDDARDLKSLHLSFRRKA